MSVCRLGRRLQLVLIAAMESREDYSLEKSRWQAHKNSCSACMGVKKLNPKNSILDEAYRKAYEWLRIQPAGSRPSRLLAQVRIEAWMLKNPGRTDYPENISKTVKIANSSLIRFESLGLLLSEDRSGRVYAWPPISKP